MEQNKEIYINPITFEAEVFMNSLQNLSKTFNNIDALTLSSLQKVTNTVQKFLDSNPREISESENIQLVKCVNLDKLKLTYTCRACENKAFKSAESITFHIANECKFDRFRNANEEEPDEQHQTPRIQCALEKYIIHRKSLEYAERMRGLLNCDFEKFIQENAESGNKMKCLPAYKIIEEDLLNLITPLFPDEYVKIHKFGSRIAGIGNKDSDLDLYVDIGQVFNIYQKGMDGKTLVKFKAVSHALHNDLDSWKGLVCIEKARVPILKIQHCDTGIECDINFSNSLGVINTQFLEYIFNLQPIAQVLCIFMKEWVKESYVSEINTYSMNLMVIFYLQTLKLAPSMEQLQEKVNQENALKVGPWLCTYDTLSPQQLNIEVKRVNKSNLVKLITGFFTFYENFDFGRDLICPYFGNVMRKFLAERLIPSRYTDFVSSHKGQCIKMHPMIAVQDPIELNINTTKNTYGLVFDNFVMYMKFSAQIMQNHYGADDLSEAKSD